MNLLWRNKETTADLKGEIYYPISNINNEDQRPVEV